MHCTGVSATPSVEQTAAGVPLHDGDARARLLGARVELGAVGVDAALPHARVVAKEVVEVLGRGHHVKGRVHREEHHLDLGVLGNASRDLGVVRGETDVADGARRAQLAHVAHEGAVAQNDPLVLLNLVHVVDHAQVDVVGVKALEKILEGRPHQVEVARARVLPVHRDRPQVPLDDPALAAVELPERVTQVGAARGVVHPAVEYVDARLLRGAHHRKRLLGRAVHPFAAKADLTDHKPRAAQRPIPHHSPLRLASSP